MRPRGCSQAGAYPLQPPAPAGAAEPHRVHEGRAGGRRPAGVRRAFPSWVRSILTEICRCPTCSCHEILRMETPGQGADLQRALGRADQSTVTGAGAAGVPGRAAGRPRGGPCRLAHPPWWTPGAYNGQLLSRRGRSLPANAGAYDTHRDSFTLRLAQVARLQAELATHKAANAALLTEHRELSRRLAQQPSSQPPPSAAMKVIGKRQPLRQPPRVHVKIMGLIIIRTG
jgi:hypothetical protein